VVCDCRVVNVVCYCDCLCDLSLWFFMSFVIVELFMCFVIVELFLWFVIVELFMWFLIA
jgi:hypothetical protein